MRVAGSKTHDLHYSPNSVSKTLHAIFLEGITWNFCLEFLEIFWKQYHKYIVFSRENNLKDVSSQLFLILSHSVKLINRGFTLVSCVWCTHIQLANTWQFYSNKYVELCSADDKENTLKTRRYTSPYPLYRM